MTAAALPEISTRLVHRGSARYGRNFPVTEILLGPPGARYMIGFLYWPTAQVIEAYSDVHGQLPPVGSRTGDTEDARRELIAGLIETYRQRSGYVQATT